MKGKRIFSAVFALIMLVSTTTGLASQPSLPTPNQTSSGSGWNITCVACNANAGRPCLALDSQSVPHVSYVHYPDSTLIYASFTPTGWVATTVDENVFTSITPALVIDANDKAHIVYFEAETRRLKYAVQTKDGWNRQVVDDTVFGAADPGIALDSANQPHISYGGENLRHAFLTSGDWITETVVTRYNYSTGTSIAIDDSDYAHIAFSAYGFMNLELGHAYQDGSGWQTETTDFTTSSLNDPSLELDQQGNPHISYYITFNDGYQGRLHYSHKDVNGWHLENFYVYNDWSLYGAHSSLELDSAGHPHISYQHVTNGDLLYKYQDAQSWYTDTVDTQGVTGFDTSLELDNLDRPRIAYAEETAGSVLYAWYAPYRLYLPSLLAQP